MLKQIYLRMAGYVVTIVMHVSNLYAMQITIRNGMITAGTLDEVGIRTFTSMEYRYLTTWTVGLQIFYAVLGLLCDLLIIKNKNVKNYKLPSHIRHFRDIMFSSVIWPSTMVVSTLFWIIFKYDRSLVFPEFLDKLVTNTTNHIIHTAIVPVALWEAVFRTRQTPKSHLRNLSRLTIYFLTYAFVLHYTHQTAGVWLYPILKVLQGTIHFTSLHLFVAVLAYFYYFAQWKLNNFIHRQDSIKKVK